MRTNNPDTDDLTSPRIRTRAHAVTVQAQCAVCTVGITTKSLPPDNEVSEKAITKAVDISPALYQ